MKFSNLPLRRSETVAGSFQTHHRTTLRRSTFWATRKPSKQHRTSYQPRFQLLHERLLHKKLFCMGPLRSGSGRAQSVGSRSTRNRVHSPLLEVLSVWWSIFRPPDRGSLFATSNVPAAVHVIPSCKQRPAHVEHAWKFRSVWNPNPIKVHASGSCAWGITYTYNSKNELQTLAGSVSEPNSFSREPLF